MDRQKNNPNGFSLIELVLVIGIMGIIIMGFSTFAAHMFRELRAADQKMEMINMERELTMVIAADLENCTDNVENITFNVNQLTGTTGPIINLPRGGILLSTSPDIFLAQPGELLPGTTTGLRVQSAQLEIVREVEPDRVYEGFFRIQMDPQSMVRSLAPIRTRYHFTTNSSGASRTIVGCRPPDQQTLLSEFDLEPIVINSSDPITFQPVEVVRIDNVPGGRRNLIQAQISMFNGGCGLSIHSCGQAYSVEYFRGSELIKVTGMTDAGSPMAGYSSGVSLNVRDHNFSLVDDAPPGQHSYSLRLRWIGSIGTVNEDGVDSSRVSDARVINRLITAQPIK